MGSDLVHVEVEEIVSILMPTAILKCKGTEDVKNASFKQYCSDIDKRYSEVEIELPAKIRAELQQRLKS